jgi:hypothetical protein
MGNSTASGVVVGTFLGVALSAGMAASAYLGWRLRDRHKVTATTKFRYSTGFTPKPSPAMPKMERISESPFHMGLPPDAQCKCGHTPIQHGTGGNHHCEIADCLCIGWERRI